MSRINLNKLPMIDLQKISDPVLTKGADQKLLTRQAQLKFLIYATEKDRVLKIISQMKSVKQMVIQIHQMQIRIQILMVKLESTAVLQKNTVLLDKTILQK